MKSSSISVSQSSSSWLQISSGGSQSPHSHAMEQVLVPVEWQEVVHEPSRPAQHASPLSHTLSQSSSTPLHVSAGGVQEPQAQEEEQTLLPVESQDVVHAPSSSLQHANPLSHASSQSSSAPLHVSGGGLHVLQLHVDVQVLIPAELHAVVQNSVIPLQHSSPLSQNVSQSSSPPLQISAGGVQ